MDRYSAQTNKHDKAGHRNRDPLRSSSRDNYPNIKLEPKSNPGLGQRSCGIQRSLKKMENHPISDERTACPECGGKIFHAVPGKTTELEIRDFQSEVLRRRGVSPGEPGWIHPGSYCYDCEWGVLAHYIPEWAQTRDEDDRPATLILDASGPEVTRVAAAIKDGAGMTSTAALRVARSAPVAVQQRPAARIWQLEQIQAKIVEAGGIAHITQNREQVVEQKP